MKRKVKTRASRPKVVRQPLDPVAKKQKAVKQYLSSYLNDPNIILENCKIEFNVEGKLSTRFIVDISRKS